MTKFIRPADFRGQFIVAPGSVSRSARQGTEVQRTGGVDVLPQDGCPAIEVTDAAGVRLGSLLGNPVDPTLGVLRGALRLPARLGNDLDGFIEEQIYALGGSFLFVLDHNGHRRIYLDAGGTMSAVYDPEAGRVAASTGLLLGPEEYERRFDGELHAFLRVPHDGWFPAGLTAHVGVRRIVVNHYLDLDTWTQHRHWPRAQLPDIEPEAACRQVAESSRRTIDALRASGSVAFALTGGNETRMLLAACRDIARELDFVTIANPSQHLDHTLVADLVSRFGLRHRFLPAVTPTSAQVEAYLTRAGHCIGDARSFPSLGPLTRVDYFVNGMGNGPGFFWRASDKADTPLDARGMATRLGMPVHPRVVAAVEKWIEGVEPFDTFLKLDLAYIELRLGCWSFANAYGVPEVRHIHPLISRVGFQSMMSLPPDWRRTKRLAEGMLRMYWPALLEVPINRYGDYRDQVRLLKRVISDPHLIAKKLRRKLA